MGVIELFATLQRHDTTSSSIKTDFAEKLPVNHFLIDFNSIVHVSSQKVLGEVNYFFKVLLKNLYQKRSINNNLILMEQFEKYQMQHIQKKIKPDTNAEDVIVIFHQFFDEKKMDKLVITLVINTVLKLIRTYCQNKEIKTLLLAIDGVPSKSKFLEQKHRRYLGTISEEYKKKITHEYQDYLMEQPDYTYLMETKNIKWSRSKITPGTAFMHKLIIYLNNEKIQTKFKTNRSQMKIIVSSMYQIGEAEIKLVRYIDKYLSGTNDHILVYSPDADMILLCMLLSAKNVFMLRHNQQTSTEQKLIYDLINIAKLKNNIGFYINNHPDYPKQNFDTERINRDIICLSTLFGNDFVPGIVSINVKQGFQYIMDAYLKTLITLKEKNYYLIKSLNNNGNKQRYSINFTFLKQILRFLLKNEDDFIKHNDVYNQYVDTGKIKIAFDFMEINSENIVSTVTQFKQEYGKLQNMIRNNQNYYYFLTNDQFMSILKKSLNIMIDGQSVNITYLSNKEIINLIKNFYRKTRNFPRVFYGLNTYSRSINDKRFQEETKEMNDYQKEIFKFDRMLDEYQVKFNAYPLKLTKENIGKYYQNYFGVELFDKNNHLTKEANQVMHDYLEGLLWVFNNYFNDRIYVNHWYYQHEKAPLLRHLLMFLDSISLEYFKEMLKKIKKYDVKNLKNYFNPIEQFIYVSPITQNNLNLIPSNYRKFIKANSSDPFLSTFFAPIKEIVKQLWKETVSTDFDCRGVIFVNKCLVKSIKKPTESDDKQFLKILREIKPNEASIKRSQNTEPSY